MTKKRQAERDGSEPAVRALAMRYPDGFVLETHAHDWSQFLYANEGVMVVETARGVWVVPPHRAVWLPAGVQHRIGMRGAVAMRTVYFAQRLQVPMKETCVVSVSSLLRELVVYCASLGRLNLAVPHEARLAGLLTDLLIEIPTIPLALPMPNDPHARRIADRIRNAPAINEPLAVLARRSGAGTRTLERRFLAETGMTFGTWRQQVRLQHALCLLAQGIPVATVATEVGYARPNAFIAMFRAALGKTPSKYFA